MDADEHRSAGAARPSGRQIAKCPSENGWPPGPSRRAAKASSPRRQPWVDSGGRVKPRPGRQKMEPAGTTALLPPLPGLGGSASADPRLTPWATLGRTSGAETAPRGAFRQALTQSTQRAQSKWMVMDGRVDRLGEGERRRGRTAGCRPLCALGDLCARRSPIYDHSQSTAATALSSRTRRAYSRPFDP